MGALRKGLILAAVAALTAPGSAAAAEVVVTLEQPALARATAASRALSGQHKARRLDLQAPTSRAYLAELGRAQGRVERAIRSVSPDARVRWRYQVVLNALAVVVPDRDVARLERVPGVARVERGGLYRPLLDRSASLIAAPTLWGPELTTAGQGLKIGIIDQGVDQRHPFFRPNGYAMPAGFPKGQRAYTTAKVIVARAFPPPGTTSREASLPFDPDDDHGTHVAGIAAGNPSTPGPAGLSLSGVAPRAYIGNYRVLAVPSPFGSNGNAPEIARAIEAAVRDGMDVINLSLGEFEIEPSRDLVTRAIDAAATAGVVPVVSAGNDFQQFGAGSISSPGTAARAITVAASSNDRGLSPPNVIEGFSSAGPTPVSLRFKPDVTAPGGSVLSAVPGGDWSILSGTSMAAPHIAGAAALLRQRHSAWTVAQIKSALVQTAGPVVDDFGSEREVSPTREGGGRADLVSADAPLLFASPTGIALGLVRPGAQLRASVSLRDAGGGAGTWSGTLVQRGTTTGQFEAQVPGRLTVTLRAPTAEGDVAGFVVLRKGNAARRIPYWYRVATRRLAAPTRTITRPGTYAGSTADRPARVDSYRYPEYLRTARGPEQVFRIRLRRPAENVGVAVVSRGPGVRVEPRIVRDGNENRLAGFMALPLHVNPYVSRAGSAVPVAGVLRPRAGTYDVVFDSSTVAGAGAFRFRVWFGDTTPPSIGVGGSPARGILTVRVTDRGAGVDPESLTATVDGQVRRVRFSASLARVDIAGLSRGRHVLVFRASDYQETKNNENALEILPNTRQVRAVFSVR
jgi:subtilisin family serine protease